VPLVIAIAGKKATSYQKPGYDTAMHNDNVWVTRAPAGAKSLYPPIAVSKIEET
jgi:hypothetical protein